MVNEQKIAIIGMSGLFPGSETMDAFWQNLLEKKDLTSLATAEDFGVDPEVFYDQGKGVVDKCYSLRGGYIRDFHFDAEGYALPAEFLARQDKIYQWSMHVAREALRDSGYWQKEEALRRCGLVLGNLSFPTGSSHKLLASVYTDTVEKALRKLLQEPDFRMPDQLQPRPQNEILDYTTSRMVVDALGLGGGHYALDAACATSLYAIKLAGDELLTGQADLMLAGAVCASDQLFIHMGFSIFHAYAPMDGKFVPLDRHSAGLVSSEGAGLVVLKRLEDAERDGDRILAVLGGIGLSNDGRGKFLLSPNPKGQRLAFERAYNGHDILPENTTYLECHATGTPLGDVTELNSIADYFSQYGARPLLGSVKSNMGHLLTAAGMTGLCKVLLAMEKGVIPPNINLSEPLEARNGWEGVDQMILSTQAWKDERKQAGINSFGFGGTNAHMVVHKWEREEEQADHFSPVPRQPMAIVGMDAHFGDCTTLDDFYQTIYHGRQHFRELPAGRWKGFDANEELLKNYGFSDGKAPRGAYIDHFDIDLLRYKIQPAEAETMEPQQALILKVADRALMDAGMEESRNVAVLIAMESELAIHHYLARWDMSWQLKEALTRSGIELDEAQEELLMELCKNGVYEREGSQTPSQHTSFVGNIMASRIASLWDFSGPAFTVSCAENSAFKALELAQNMLSLAEVEAVVVGGVDFAGSLENVLLRNRKHPVNRSGAPSLSFNREDEGWLVGEGAGAIVLKRSGEAGEEKVYAVIDAVGPAAPELNIGYQELAATGIAEQDERELAQLLAARQQQPVALGSVKTNIGHTYAAAGIAALIKTALCLHYRFLAGIPNWEAPKHREHFDGKNYYFPPSSRPWIRPDGVEKRRAAVNGLDGLQVLLSETAEVTPERTPLLERAAPRLFPLKGSSATELKQQLSALDIALETPAALAEIAGQFYAAFQKKEGPYCLVLLAETKKQLQRELRFFEKTIEKAVTQQQTLRTPQGSYFTAAPLGADGKIAFVYPGSSTAYAGLGRELFQLFPAMLPHFEALAPSLERSVWPDYLYPKTIGRDDPTPDIHEDAIAMMSVGVFHTAAYTHLLRDYFRLEPDIAFGYSMGECSSMWYALGLWAPEGARIFQESPVFQRRFSGRLELLAEHWGISSEEARQRWVSLVLLAPKEDVETLIEKEEHVYLSFINTEKEVVISGDREACHAIAAQLQCHTLELPFQNVIHHDFCGREYEALIEMHCFPLQAEPAIDFYSSISRSKLPLDSRAIAENSTAVCCRHVDFPGTVETVYSDGARIFIELGANATCSGWIDTILAGRPHLAVSIDHKGKTNGQAILELLAQLLSHGVAPDLSGLFPAAAVREEKRSFLKQIIPGGARIFDTLLSEANRERFASVPKRQVAEPAFAEAAASAVTTIKNQGRTSVPPIKKSGNAVFNMEISIQSPDAGKEPAQPSEPRLGENGLRLQDYSSGEQLEGKEIVFSQEDLVEFATGKIANVFGPEYAVIDTYRRRVMLPMAPYLLVSRVTGLDARMGEYKPSTMQTEYDIPYNAWFTTDGQIPWAVSVESGQCDLLLISYLGIDFQNKGDLVYRLLDCTLTFVDDLPYEGQTLRYDISINSFVRNADNLLFFFSYRCYVQDRLVLKMDGGCAGFFSDEQLQVGNGVVYTDKEKAARLNAEQQYFTPLLTTEKRAFSKKDLQHLINGDIEKCFDNEAYYPNGRNPSLRLPPEKILMIDRITSVDLTGGAYGLGYIVAEKDLHPDDWYFPCHFRDDEVLAGSLQAEGGGNLLRFFMLMLGLQRLTKDARFQPVFDLPQKVRCRKEVTPKDTVLVYKLEIKEIGLLPDPYVIGDLEIISDGVVTVFFENLGLQLREKSNPRYLEEQAGVYVSPRSEGALMNEADITTFALDSLSKCFGPEYAVYDGRTVSRQPNTDLQLISRVLRIDGERHHFKQPSTIIAEYDVPENAWYYRQNSTNTMPYSILMEIALQPCGLLGAYLGSTLQFPDKNLYFRNLDGTGEMLDLPHGTDLRGKTITNKAVLVSSVALGGTVLQNYTFELSVDRQVFYKGKSSFGFFPEDALAQQVGLDNGKEVQAWYKTQGLKPNEYMQIKLDSLYGRMKLYKAPDDKPHYRLASGQLDLLDKLLIAKGSGEYGKGYIHATKYVKPYDWFYTCHFYQDPVMPGSLGVEAILQAMQVFALQQDLGKDFRSPRFVQLDNHTTVWKYRGQILRPVREMYLEVHIKSVERRGDILAVIGDAYLWNGKMRIYQVTDLALGIQELDAGC